MQIFFDYTTAYLSTRDIKLSRRYEQNVISLEMLNETIDFGVVNIDKCGVSSVGKTILKLNIQSENSLFNRGSNEFYPNSKHIINREIRIGIVWEDSTSDDDIVWIESGLVYDYTVSGQTIILPIQSVDDFTNKDLLHYKLQSDYDDGISYSENIPEGLEGTFLPTIYGGYGTSETLMKYFNYNKTFSECILMDSEKLKYCIAWHKCASISTPFDEIGFLWKWVDGANNFMNITSGRRAEQNTIKGAFKSLDDDTTTLGNTITGNLYLLNFIKGSESNISEIKNLFDDSNYITVDGGDQVSVKLNGGISSSDLGTLGIQANEIQLQISYSPINFSVGIHTQVIIFNEVTAKNSVIGYEDIDNEAHIITLNLGADVSAMNGEKLPHTIEELNEYQFIIKNLEVSEAIRLRVDYVRMYLQNIKIFRRNPKNQKVKVNLQRF